MQNLKKLFSFLIISLIAIAQFAVFAPKAYASPDEPSMPPSGTLNIITKEGEETKEFPLKHTDVRAEISGFISRVTVTQEFVNPYVQPIEAVYTFPLPQNAAVDAMEMKIGARVIKAQIKKREEARLLYEDAKASGRRAGLLEQERPNIFTQSVANILPGDTILITIKYIETLEYERGTYTFVFPMTVGPRYVPFGGVADAERITPPVLKPGERLGHDISLNVLINAGFPIKDIRSKNHEIQKLSFNSGAKCPPSMFLLVPCEEALKSPDTACKK
jgi:Ca-activated chloride channel family protein